MGYGIGRAHWKQGFTTEAARAVLDWGFATFDAVRAFATADAANVGSWTVMRKLGMTHEATLRRHRTNRYGEQIDEVMYGVLREEWEASRK
jgi:RimJ/RimL family protein N-acetyltransferase